MRRLPAVVVVLAAGCSATIHRHRGPALHAQIVDGNHELLVIDDGRGGLQKVPRREVRDIDHPGLWAWIAAGVLVSGGLVLGLTAPEEPEENEHGWNAQNLGGLGLVGLGLTVAVVGAVMRGESVRNEHLDGAYVKQAWPVLGAP